MAIERTLQRAEGPPRKDMNIPSLLSYSSPSFLFSRSITSQLPRFKKLTCQFISHFYSWERIKVSFTAQLVFSLITGSTIPRWRKDPVWRQKLVTSPPYNCINWEKVTDISLSVFPAVK
jgi:hypothetical protein